MSPQVGCLGGADLGIEGGEGGEVAVSPREAEQLYRHLLSRTNDLRVFFCLEFKGLRDQICTTQGPKVNCMKAS
jgi:hypothetical protein